MQQHILNCLHALGTMLVCCGCIANVGAGNGLCKIASKNIDMRTSSIVRRQEELVLEISIEYVMKFL